MFDDGVIRLQMIMTYQPTFSAALIGDIEAVQADDEIKRRLCRPATMTDTVEDYLQVMATSISDQTACNASPEVRGWIRSCRLDGFGATVAQVAKDDTPRRAALARIAAASDPAVQNLQRLTAALS